MARSLIIGSRKSRLAVWQAEFVRRQLAEIGVAAEIRFIVTSGDLSQASGKPLPKIGGKGLFTAELEQALREKEIDLAVHSLKDLPTDSPPEFVIGAIPRRGPTGEVLISRGGLPLAALPPGARIGSSSLRRALQLKRLRPDVETLSVRGNVETRIAKVSAPEHQYDAIMLAEAGVRRLELDAHISECFDEERILPAPGQGALAVQCRSGDDELCAVLQQLDHPETRAEVEAERVFLKALQAGCSAPVGARATFREGRLVFHGRCLKLDGSAVIEVRGEDDARGADALGERMAAEAVRQGYDPMEWRMEGSREH